MSEIDWKRMFIMLTDACLRNESCLPNLENIHESTWTKHEPLTEKENNETQKVIKQRHKKFRKYMND